MEAAQKDPLSGDLGLVLKSKAKHAAISAPLGKIYKFDEKPFIVQYELNFQVLLTFFREFIAFELLIKTFDFAGWPRLWWRLH